MGTGLMGARLFSEGTGQFDREGEFPLRVWRVLGWDSDAKKKSRWSFA